MYAIDAQRKSAAHSCIGNKILSAASQVVIPNRQGSKLMKSLYVATLLVAVPIFAIGKWCERSARQRDAGSCRTTLIG